jgi:DNA-directed RNA polymerase specialized sigma24 family protein
MLLQLAGTWTAPDSRRSTRVIKAMAIAQHKTRRRELRDGRALARRVQRGDRRAFELLYTSYEGRLYRFCHRLSGSDAAAAALVEATFARGVETLPESGLDTLDVPGHLSATARVLAHERHTNGGTPWLDPIPGEHAGEVGAANQRMSPRQRMALALRDLEASPDDEIALALGAEAAAVPALVARARLRLRRELGLPGAPEGCGERLPALSAYADGTLPDDRRAQLETHVSGCSSCRAALFALREAALRYRALPVPVPPGELRSRLTVALGAVGFPTRRPRALMPDPAPAASGRPMAAAATMAALVIVGAGVTFVASRSDDARGEPARAPATPPRATANANANAVLFSTVTTAANTAASNVARAMAPRRAPPIVRHLRTGPPRPAARGSVARANPPGAATASASRPRFSGAPAAAAPPPAPPAAPPEPSPLAAPAAKPQKLQEIPVQILPPVAPPHSPATAEAPPPPPEPPPPAAPAEPAQTTST